MEKNNIVLIGMPASGKSTVGVILAKVLGYSFLDCDIVIQNEVKKKLHEIISENGIDGFIAIEDKINSSINVSNTVIATGGSAVYGENEMKHFKEIGTVIYLKVDYDRLVKRLGNIQQRGVVIRENQTFEQLYEERCSLYEKYADVTIEETAEDAEIVLRSIVDRISPKSVK
ncbi:shikimate kinase [Butyrivibrio sp. NC3005]|uniref:shikimate kinase n=1 Tax=Butyrivibrio sp. NC3005 TaxID=1280685 RepID=UPI000415ACA2|nr:shikimate kinase [Butyrivibrio sp. NC3005]